MNWKDLFKKPRNKLEGDETAAEPVYPCPKCGGENTRRAVRDNLYVCPLCGHYYRMSPKQRIAMLADEGSFTELFADVKRELAFEFPDYEEKLAAAEKKSGDYESVTCGVCTVGGCKTVLFVMNSAFMMGSMGSVTGERIARCFDYARENMLPVIGVTVSGGARMQEGIISLMQMAKVSVAIKRHGEAGLLYTVLLTDPTTGGVSASLAMLGDITLAEPRALICFAGPRVIEQTLRQKLPENFQLAESLLNDGFVDAIVERRRQREYLTLLLKLHTSERRDSI